MTLQAGSRVVDWSTEAVDPLRLLALLDQGMPHEAIRADGTLDPEILRQHGWYLSGGHLYHGDGGAPAPPIAPPPPTPPRPGGPGQPPGHPRQ